MNLYLNLDILALCETNVDDSIDFGNFSVRGITSFNQKEFNHSNAWLCNLREERASLCIGLVSRKVRVLTDIFDWLYFIQCLTSLSSFDHLLCFYAQFLMLYYVTDEVLPINPPATVFVFADLNAYHKD